MIERGRWYRAQMGGSEDGSFEVAVRLCVTTTGRIYVMRTGGGVRFVPNEATLVSEKNGVLRASYQVTYNVRRRGGGQMVAGERWFRELVPE